MGCDWYSVVNISACGVIIDEKDDELIMEIKEKINNNKEYEILLFKNSDERIKFFVYKKETKTFIFTDFPGPYEIEDHDLFTTIVDNNKITHLLKDDIKNMEDFLKIKDCKYTSILTAFGVGLLNTCDNLPSNNIKGTLPSNNIKGTLPSNNIKGTLPSNNIKGTCDNLKCFSSIQEYNNWYGYNLSDKIEPCDLVQRLCKLSY
jgi:hypothetical protein